MESNGGCPGCGRQLSHTKDCAWVAGQMEKYMKRKVQELVRGWQDLGTPDQQIKDALGFGIMCVVHGHPKKKDSTEKQGE